MKRVILHWTAGSYNPNSVDKEHYHYLITGDAIVVEGNYSPLDNENCNDNKYAKHCGGGNTGSIGVAFCGMYGFKNMKDVGDYPLRKNQVEKGFELVAKLVKKYNINKITPDTVLTHYEFGKKNPKTSSFGKIDIVYLPPYSWVSEDKIGDFIRGKVRWYYQRLLSHNV